MKILAIDDMLRAATETEMPHLDAYQRLIEASATALASALAAHLKIISGPATFEDGFGGTCATFRPSKEGQPCPEVIDAGDTGGDWELQPYEKGE